MSIFNQNKDLENKNNIFLNYNSTITMTFLDSLNS